MERPIRVLCVDDSADICAILERLIRRDPDLESVGTLCSTRGIVDEAIKRAADVVVLDLTMPSPEADLDPMDAIRELARRAPACRVIAFSGHDDAETRDEVHRAGAWGLVSKHGEPREIIEVVRRVGRNGTCGNNGTDRG